MKNTAKIRVNTLEILAVNGIAIITFWEHSILVPVVDCAEVMNFSYNSPDYDGSCRVDRTEECDLDTSLI